jgi:Winged helix-turn-helix domain (DUF2582)
MSEEIGTTAGAIWHALEKSGELTLSGLKKQVNIASPLFDWAIGWLAREHKIILTKDNRSWLVRLEGQSANAVGHRKAPSISHAAGASA